MKINSKVLDSMILTQNALLIKAILNISPKNELRNFYKPWAYIRGLTEYLLLHHIFKIFKKA